MAGYSGLFNGVYGGDYAVLPNATGNVQTDLARVMSKKAYGRGAYRGLMLALVGAAAGEAALVTHKRVQAQRDLYENVQGGLRPIETFTEIDRDTTADDITAVEAALSLSSQPTTYPVDRSGNGGGGKLGI